MADLSDKTVLVTGSSRGIGASIATLLAHDGAKVAITYSHRKEAAEKILSDLPGSGHICTQLDISDESSVQKSINEVYKEFGQVDALVNNAGITKDQIMLRMKTEEFDAVINTNLRGTYLCTKSVLKPMIKARKGSIVNITSVIGQMGNAGQANYAASKAGIEAFTKSIAKEVGSRNIRANCIAPGFIVTEMTKQLDEKQKEDILSRVALGSLGQPKDIAQAVSFLIGEESCYITGQTISVNGGLYM